MAGRIKDFFSVELKMPSGHALPTIEFDAQRWFVAEPGNEFQVHVSMTNTSGKTYRVSLRVDGSDPGYSLIYSGLNPAYTSVFQGWLQQSGTISGPCATTYRLFKLGSCKPSTSAATVGSVEELAVGKVEVLIDEVVDTGRQSGPLNLQAALPTRDAADKKLPEGKKWFLAPGLKAEAGSVKASTTNWNTKVYQKIGSLPSLKVRYDSSEALFLRKALNPRFAPHRAILRRSANEAIAKLGIEPATDSGAPDEAMSRPGGAAAAAGGGGGARAGAAAAAGRGRIKREAGVAGVKRERGVGGADDEEEEDDFVIPRSATAADRVDLTEEPVRPMTINGRQLAPDELAVCDLCDSDEDEAPAARWQVKKKQQVEVEL